MSSHFIKFFSKGEIVLVLQNPKDQTRKSLQIKKRKIKESPVVQEHSMGCAVACVAFRCGLSYEKALRLFSVREHAWTRGFYCEEIAEALKKFGLDYEFGEFDSSLHSKCLHKAGSIVFIQPNSFYAFGHFLIRAKQGWMNPWLNFPRMHPAEAGFENELPGMPSYILFQV